jgi:two-component system nitrogen regulation response regulator NtrX
MGGRVLLLEDEPTIRDLVEAVLTDDGHEVVAHDSFQQLLEAANGATGTLAVADFWGCSHQRLAADEREDIVRLACTVPTVLVTGRTWVGTTTPADLGLVALIPKPFDVGHLADVVAASLGQACAGR